MAFRMTQTTVSDRHVFIFRS